MSPGIIGEVGWVSTTVTGSATHGGPVSGDGVILVDIAQCLEIWGEVDESPVRC